jgi:hypothetical protein
VERTRVLGRDVYPNQTNTKESKMDNEELIMAINELLEDQNPHTLNSIVSNIRESRAFACSDQIFNVMTYTVIKCLVLLNVEGDKE